MRITAADESNFSTANNDSAPKRTSPEFHRFSCISSEQKTISPVRAPASAMKQTPIRDNCSGHLHRFCSPEIAKPPFVILPTLHHFNVFQSQVQRTLTENEEDFMNEA